jgi:hypothetical protein
MSDDLSIFKDIPLPHPIPGIRVGMLVRVLAFGDCVFPIRGISPDLLSLQAACGEPSETIWGVFSGPNESLVGLVVRVGSSGRGEVVYEVLVGEDVLYLDGFLMNDYPYCTPPSAWRIVQLQVDDLLE